LAIYAVLGVILLFFRHLPIKLILIISLVLIINLPTHVVNTFKIESIDASITLPMQERAVKYYDLIKNEGFLTVLKDNWNSWPLKMKYQLESGRLLMTFGYFLLGFYAGCTKLLTSIEKNISKFITWNKFMESGILILLMIGLIMYLNDYVTIPDITIVPKYKWMATILFDIYNGCVTIFYITGITILFRNNFIHTLLEPLAAMGRMALTNYLLQTAFGLLIFYHFGLGLFDKTTPSINVLLAVGVFYLQLKFSQWWLKHFKQGPVEWLWKSLTHFRFSPIKRE
jgi:uncharacterized protein